MLKDHVPVTSEITQDLLNSHHAELLLTFENAKAEFISVVENMKSKIKNFNDLLSISELTKHKNVILVKIIGREVRYFNTYNGHCDGLHLNRKVGCKALSRITLKTIYANLRSHCKNQKVIGLRIDHIEL